MCYEVPIFDRHLDSPLEVVRYTIPQRATASHRQLNMTLIFLSLIAAKPRAHTELLPHHDISCYDDRCALFSSRDA